MSKETPSSDENILNIKTMLNEAYNTLKKDQENQIDIESTAYMLPNDMVIASIIRTLAKEDNISAEDVDKKYNIQGIELQYDLNDEEIKNSLGIYNLDKFVTESKSGKITFLPFTDGKHTVAIAIVPNKDNTDKPHLIYVNSITPTPDSNSSLANTGLVFAKSLANKHDLNFQDLSSNTQYDNTCGIATMLNCQSIASLYGENKSLSAESIRTNNKFAALVDDSSTSQDSKKIFLTNQLVDLQKYLNSYGTATDKNRFLQTPFNNLTLSLNDEQKN